MYALVEAGGTKFLLALATADGLIVEETRIETRDPSVTLGEALLWLKQAGVRHGKIEAVGVASFGPIEVDRTSPSWGVIGTTPKAGWSGVDIARPFREAFGAPVGLNTDVNAAALAESTWGAARGQRLAVYLTIGTGIGGGAVIDGEILQGLSHPEMGHMRVERHRDDTYAGICPLHGECLEGLASGPAIARRWGRALSDLPDDHPGHDMIAFYLAQACVNLQALLAPGRIVLGGGVTETPSLIERVRKAADKLSGGYFRGEPDQIIVGAALSPRSGLIGAWALAQSAALRSS